MPSHSMRVSPPWRVYGGGLLQPAPFLVAGIVNITPDSFSDGGNFFSLDHAIARVRQVVAEGPHIVDLGAESTRPGAEDIGSGEEWRRLGPVLRQTLQLRAAQRFSVSIDTFRAATAAAALSLPMDGKPGSTSGPLQGADIINDISGASFDPAMPEVLAGFKPGYVLGHSPSLPSCMQSCPKYEDVAAELLNWFEQRMAVLVKAGLPEECIALDPCIGFGKTLEHNLEVIRAIPRFAALGRPLFFGISRKSILGDLTGLPVAERETATQVLTALLAGSGVAIHRVHDVKSTVLTLNIVRAVTAEVPS